MLVRYFEVELCLLFMLDGVQLSIHQGFYGFNGFNGFGSCNSATYTGKHCCCTIGSSKTRCCSSFGSKYCCTRTEERYRGSYCISSVDCSSSTKPKCCSLSNKCCTRRKYDIETPRCNSITDCAKDAKAPYCCDSEARCCTNAAYAKEYCSSDDNCRTTTKPHCCDDSKCCTLKQYEIENPPPSEMLRRNSAALCAVALLLLAGMLSLSVICLGCVYSCGAKPTKRRETARSTESFATVTSRIDLPSAQQHATPTQNPPRGNAFNEDGSIPCQAVATDPVTELPTYNDLLPTYELATTSKVFRTVTLPSGGS